jgi:hypothetical protein
MIASDSESDVSNNPTPTGEPRAGLLKLGAVAIASALLGGIAAAWWYRKTVRKLHETGENANNPHFGIASDGSADEMADDF